MERRATAPGSNVPESEIHSPFFEACVLEKFGTAPFPPVSEGFTVKFELRVRVDPGGGFGGESPEP